MIKRIIFDLDDTLIPWLDDYFIGFIPKMKEYNVISNIEEMIEFSNIVNEYENYHSRYDDELFVKYVNERMNKDIPNEFYEDFKNYFYNCIPKKIDNNVIETLEYLKDKYDLIVLTNFFEDHQIKRLEGYGIKDYFKEIYGGDKYLKPSKESYLMACGDCKPNECIMIGDNYTNDYEGAIKAGLKAIYLNLKDIEVDKDVTSIKSLIELKNIL